VRMDRIAADGTPGSPETIGMGGPGEIESDAQGRAVVVHPGPLGNDFTRHSFRAQAVEIAADGTVGPEMDVSSIGVDSTALAMDDRGRAIVAWSTGDAFAKKSKHQIQVRTLDPGGELGRLRTLSERDERGFNPVVAANGGRTTVGWVSKDRVRVRQLDGAGKPAAAALTLSRKHAVASAPRLLPLGKRTSIAWSQAHRWRVVTSGLSAKGKPLPLVKAPERARGPVLALGPQGDPLLASVGLEGGSFLSDLPFGKGPANTRPLFGDAVTSGIDLATGPAGEVTVVGRVERALPGRSSIELVREPAPPSP